MFEWLSDKFKSLNPFAKKEEQPPADTQAQPGSAPGAGGRRRHRTRHRKSKSKRRRTGRKPTRP